VQNPGDCRKQSRGTDDDPIRPGEETHRAILPDAALTGS